MNRNQSARPAAARACSARSLAALAAIPLGALASSHREAPAITQMPKLDGTDLYAFRSYEPGRSNYVTFIANYVPLQDSYGGPNYFTMDPDGFYDIQHRQQRRRAREHHVSLPLPVRRQGHRAQRRRQLRSRSRCATRVRFGVGNTAALNDTETYTVELVNGPNVANAAARTC